MEQIYFGGRIAALRKSRKMTQEALAQRLGVTNQAVSKWESDQCCPDIMQLPALADIFEISLDALFGRETPAQQEPVAVHDLPWEDNGDLHAVCYVGHQLVTYQEIIKPERRDVRSCFLEMSRGDSVVLAYSGSVGNIYSDFSVTCQDVQGNVQAGGAVTCGDVNGQVNAGDSLSCGNIQGGAFAGDSITCSVIGTYAQAGDSIRCDGMIGGNAQSGGDLTCTEIGGRVQCDGDLTCSGNIQGDAKAEGDIECGSVGGNAQSGGDLTCTAIGGRVQCDGDLTCHGDIRGDAKAEGDIRCMSHG